MTYQRHLFKKKGWLPISLFFHLIFFIFFNTKLFSQKNADSLKAKYKYELKIIEGTSKTTLNQSYSNVITASRFLSRVLEGGDTKLAEFIKIIVPTIGLGISHEEAHRSVLTNLKIGSISQPFSFDTGLLYIKGVSDKTLIDLRDSSLPDFIHLHTSGLESDYMSTLELENFIAFELDDFSHLKYDYFTRKLSHLFYFITTITPFLFPDFEEEENELERDIVGHDILGTIRHLHRPTETFYRYTFFNDLTNDEKKYARKTVLYSFSNLVNPMLFGKKYYTIGNSTINFSLGYSLAPFGGHFDQNIWLKNKKLNLYIYTRQFHNKNNWFFGSGIRAINYPINKSLFIDLGFHYWNQPNNLSFIESDSFIGVGGEVKMAYKMLTLNKNKNDVYIVSGIRWKDIGFLPGYTSLKEKAQISVGFEFSW